MSKPEILDNENERIFCSRCGRPLKGKRSRELGYGPSCYVLWKKERSQQKNLLDCDEGCSK